MRVDTPEPEMGGNAERKENCDGNETGRWRGKGRRRGWQKWKEQMAGAKATAGMAEATEHRGIPSGYFWQMHFGILRELLK